MKKTTSIIFALFFILIGFLLNPAPAYADISCPNNGNTVESAGNNQLKITVNNVGGATVNDYDLIYAAGRDVNLGRVCQVQAATTVVCIVDVATLNTTSWKNNADPIAFKLNNSGDNCTFSLQNSDIQTAISSTTPLPAPPGSCPYSCRPQICCTIPGTPPTYECRYPTDCTGSPPAPPGGGTVTLPCQTEFDPVGTNTGVETGLGCIPTQPQELVKWILKYAILMGGGIAFLLSLFGGVSIILAGGNPEKINAGKEIIGSALTGLLFIIFSVFLLRFIGFDILQLPGFGK